MQNKILQTIAVLLFLIPLSCTSYIKPIHTKPVSGAENITRKLILQNETMEVNFYGDYIFDRVDKNFIFFTNKDISGILANLELKPSSQVLFTYTRSSIYNNMLGFYYHGKTLQDIKNNVSGKTPEKEMQGGLLYTYQYKSFYIMDWYKQEEKGVVRFISVNNSAKQSVDKFRLENTNLFFEINSFWK
ncbi:hypothetical protein [Chryseobacterium kwangjuense]|uniref:Uncharacterized protein n=1 Tax=Chryseobacterium kwangjuense TaxID=267125 RepID=A0A135W3N4_9FLAO|nr:hypothetical protein [Chryseobacterium kwangjuense]KXH79544.1 hypothetical protein AU378_19430 [Chryseobacterium kwangjuense]